MNELHEHEDGSVTVTMHFKSRDAMQVTRQDYEKMEEEVKAFFIVAGFQVKEIFQIANQYWVGGGVDVMDFQYIAYNPWWLVQTTHGMIIFGRRKRVWEIDWSRTPFRGKILAEDDSTTNSDNFVHCWEREDIVRDLTRLCKELREQARNCAPEEVT